MALNPALRAMIATSQLKYEEGGAVSANLAEYLVSQLLRAYQMSPADWADTDFRVWAADMVATMEVIRDV